MITRFAPSFEEKMDFKQQEQELLSAKKEKNRARELRRSRWWQEKISACSCYYCGKKLAKAEVTMDHIIPLSRGGRSVPGNVATACKDCNNKKNYQIPVESILEELAATRSASQYHAPLEE